MKRNGGLKADGSNETAINKQINEKKEGKRRKKDESYIIATESNEYGRTLALLLDEGWVTKQLA